MPYTLLCQNMPCPQPVLRTREYIANNNPEMFTVVVDNMAACENVTRFLQSQGYSVNAGKNGEIWQLDASRSGDISAQQHSAANMPERDTAATGKTLVVIPSGVFGSGDDTLGIKLMKNFLLTLPEMGENLWRIILLNGGVTLSTAESPVLAELQALEKQGVSILVCGSCLEFFGILDKKVLGETTNMLDVVTSMQVADKVLRI